MSTNRDDWTKAVTKLTLPKRSKYGAVKVTIDGHTFDSKREAQRYHELKLLEKAGQISELTLQPAFELYVQPYPALAEATVIRVGKYTADFRYIEGGATVIEDVKSPSSRTEAYQLRKRMVQAQYGIQIHET